MEIGIGLVESLDYEVQFKIFKKFGIKRTFTSSKVSDYERLSKLLKEYDIVCETIHSPFDHINDMWGDDDEAGEKILNRLKESVDRCEKYGIPVTVVHVSSGRPMPEITEIGVKRYEELFCYAKSKGVKVALENLRYLENLKYFFDKCVDVGFCWDNGHQSCYSNVGFCWDNGHQYCRGENIDYMDMFSDKLIALHIHDNRAGLDTDDHLLPFDGNIDFDVVAKAIADSGYEGTLMLEVFKNSTKGDEKPYESLTEEEYYERAFNSAKKLLDMIESYR